MVFSLPTSVENCGNKKATPFLLLNLKVFLYVCFNRRQSFVLFECLLIGFCHKRPVAYRDFSGQACNDEMMTSSVSKFSSILIFDKTSNF